MKRTTYFILALMLFSCAAGPQYALVKYQTTDKAKILQKVTSALIELGYSVNHTDQDLGLISTDFRPAAQGTGQEFLAGIMTSSPPELKLNLKVTTTDRAANVKISSITQTTDLHGNKSISNSPSERQIEQLIKKLNEYLGEEAHVQYLDQ